LKEMHEDMLENLGVKLLVSFATIFGVLSSYIVSPSANTAYSLFGFIGGMFIYVVIHDSLRPKTERPLGFVLGVLCFILLVFVV